jgi:hypothetical protein
MEGAGAAAGTGAGVVRGSAGREGRESGGEERRRKREPSISTNSAWKKRAVALPVESCTEEERRVMVRSQRD